MVRNHFANNGFSEQETPTVRHPGLSQNNFVEGMLSPSPHPEPGQRPLLRTVAEAAARMRVCDRTVWRLIQRGTGPPVLRIGRKVFIVDLEEWLQSRASEP